MEATNAHFGWLYFGVANIITTTKMKIMRKISIDQTTSIFV